VHKLLTIQKREDVPEKFRDTPVGDLLIYHNTSAPHREYDRAELLIGMCMDNRKVLGIPDKFAYVIRAAGANLRYSEFNVSYAIAVGGVEHIALVGHTHCGMVNLNSQSEQFIKGLCEHAGWTAEQAEEQFLHTAPLYEIGQETNFILGETKRLSQRYPKVKVAPLLYQVEDNRLYWVTDSLA